MNYKELEQKIIQSYQEGVTLESAERLAAEFLHAMLSISEELKLKDLDARMRKTGVKSVRAAAYLNIVQTSEGKKPTEAQITATLDADKIIVTEQDAFDTAEVTVAALERQYSVFQNAHIYYRGVSKGRFD